MVHSKFKGSLVLRRSILILGLLSSSLSWGAISSFQLVETPMVRTAESLNGDSVNLDIKSGDALNTAGDIVLTPGSGGTADGKIRPVGEFSLGDSWVTTPDGGSGVMRFTTGSGVASGGATGGGDIEFVLGSAYGASNAGNFSVFGGYAAGGHSTNIYMSAGGATSGVGGYTSIYSGAVTSGIAGALSLIGGPASTGSGGPIEITAGDVSDNAGTPGDVIISAGSKPNLTKGKIYIEADEGSSGQCLVSYGVNGEAHWDSCPGADVSSYNYLVNGGFDLWQVGTSATVTSVGGGTPSSVYLYQADQWYVTNKLGRSTTAGVITYSQVAGVTDGSKYGAKVQITTAPVGTGTNATTPSIDQPLSNAATIPLLGKTVSFSVYVKALGNVDTVNVYVMYATTEVKLTNALTGLPCTVNSATFTLCTLPAVSVGTTPTTSGILGVRVSINSVSSGNYYDLNNGFVIEQAMLNVGALPVAFTRQHNNPVDELAAAQYFYEPIAGNGFTGTTNGTTTCELAYSFKVTKRTAPTVTALAAGTVNVRSSGTDKATGNPATIANTTADTTGFWTQVTNFTGLTSAVPCFDRGTNSAWGQADARL